MSTYEDIPGHFNFEDIYIDAVDKAPEGSILVEIGSYLGRSAVFMAEQIKMSGKNLKFYVVDDWKDEYFADSDLFSHMNYGKPAYEVFLDHINKAGVADVINVIKQPSPQAADVFKDNSCFFVFIDGDHRRKAVEKDCTAWKKKLVKHGICAGHDYERGKVRNAVKATIGNRVVPVYRSWVHCPDSKFYVMSERATLQYALKHNCSIIRMGTGEIKYLLGKGHTYNDDPKHRPNIIETFKKILSHNGVLKYEQSRVEKKSFLATIPRFWEPFDRYADKWHQEFLSNYFSKFSKIEKFLNPNTFYGSMLFSRLDMAPQPPYFWDMAKRLWAGRKVATVTGEHLSLTEFGDLFDGADIIKEIKVTPKNAYGDRDWVLREIRKLSKDTLILCSCGFLASCLCYELSFNGFQALDIGRIGRGYLTPTLEGYKNSVKLWKGIKVAA